LFNKNEGIRSKEAHKIRSRDQVSIFFSIEQAVCTQANSSNGRASYDACKCKGPKGLVLRLMYFFSVCANADDDAALALAV
jgi:hypothetical protein